MNEELHFPVKQVYILKIINHKPTDLFFYRTDDCKSKTEWVQELVIMRKNLEKLNLVKNQLTPVHSREKFFKWYIMQDQFDYVSLILAYEKETSSRLIINLHEVVCEKVRKFEEIYLNAAYNFKVKWVSLGLSLKEKSLSVIYIEKYGTGLIFKFPNFQLLIDGKGSRKPCIYCDFEKMIIESQSISIAIKKL